jgi:hypothetical protein
MTDDRSANLGPGEDGILGPGSGPAAKHKSEHYGDAEFLDEQLRLTDLVPRRLLTMILLPASGLIAIASLLTLYVAAPKIFKQVDPTPLAAVLGGPGSLGNWLSALMLLTASFFAVVNFTIRRHKVDDYHGRYRIWLWAAACWFLMATDSAASLHQGFQAVLVSLTHMKLVGDGSIWWIAPGMLLLGVVGARLVVDMWPCRSASATAILAAVSYLAATLALYHVVRLPSELAGLLVLNGSLLVGHLLLAWSMSLHARFVLLDAEGQLPRRAAKPKAKKKRIEKPKEKPVRAPAAESMKKVSNAGSTSNDEDADESESPDKWISVHQAHSGPTPSSPSLAKRPGPLAAHVASSASSDADSKMSKADRKALKKKLLDERMKSEQRRASNW